MSPLSKVKQSRQQWKHKAIQRANHDRYRRKQLARSTQERDRATTALKEAQARLRQIEAQSHGLAVPNKVDLVFLALQLFLVARIGFRAVSRVLSLLALALGKRVSNAVSSGHRKSTKPMRNIRSMCQDIERQDVNEGHIPGTKIKPQRPLLDTLSESHERVWLS